MRDFFMDAGAGWYIFILALMGVAVGVYLKIRKKMYGGAPKKRGLIK